MTHKQEQERINRKVKGKAIHKITFHQSFRYEGKIKIVRILLDDGSHIFIEFDAWEKELFCDVVN